ncbi:Lysine 2,3-aminomutase [hydrothermal vent metagenome]|uniref:L-lysine 2,3-aminomutase n=1 Tax=hydrothermal vent metagenome TaxID=652676 RepID=A0A3B0Y8D0_9ZZZZ
MPKPKLAKSIKSDTNHLISWQQQLAQSIITPDQLLEQLQIDNRAYNHNTGAHQQFSLKVPRAYIQKMQPGKADDPLLLQVMAQSQEMLPVDGYIKDPVAELDAGKTPGLLHKYPGRVLLITTSVCAVHCRYCFRRHFPYSEKQAARDNWSEAIRYILNDNSIKEVILSGGDPLVLSDNKLASLIAQLEAIPHLTRLRLHSRLPVVLPDRITPQLIKILKNNRFDVSLVIHANHGNEITSAEVNALKALQYSGIHLLNQAVLLKNINNTLKNQLLLSEKLYSAGVLPYYLHLLDPVQGAAHFDVSLDAANRLINGMREQLPGFLVPRLVREISGKLSKTPASEL